MKYEVQAEAGVFKNDAAWVNILFPMCFRRIFVHRRFHEWRFGLLSIQKVYRKEHVKKVDAMHANYDTGILATGSKDRTVKLYNPRSMFLLQTLYHNDRVFSIRLGVRFITVRTLRRVYVYRKEGELFKMHHEVKMNVEVMRCLRFLRDDVVLTGGGNELAFIDANSGQIMKRFEVEASYIQDFEPLSNNTVAIVGDGELNGDRRLSKRQSEEERRIGERNVDENSPNQLAQSLQTQQHTVEQHQDDGDAKGLLDQDVNDKKKILIFPSGDADSNRFSCIVQYYPSKDGVQVQKKVEAVSAAKNTMIPKA